MAQIIIGGTLSIEEETGTAIVGGKEGRWMTW
jgi:hypothetical protein